MNAYELAQKLNDAVNKNEKHLTLDIEAMLMLRQQADRIAELEKDLHMIQRHYDQLETSLSGNNGKRLNETNESLPRGKE